MKKYIKYLTILALCLGSIEGYSAETSSPKAAKAGVEETKNDYVIGVAAVIFAALAVTLGVVLSKNHSGSHSH